MKIKNILIAESHPLLLLGIEQIIVELIPKSQITAVESFKKVIKLTDNQRFDLMIIDISIPGGDSIAIIEKIKKKQPSVPILINSGYSEELYALPYLKAGADGYISKEAPLREFKLAIETVLNARVYASPVVHQNALGILFNSKTTNGSLTSSLSEKELEIVKWLCQGATIKAISELINLSSSSVSNYKRSIYKKLNVDSVIELKAYIDLNS